MQVVKEILNAMLNARSSIEQVDGSQWLWLPVGTYIKTGHELIDNIEHSGLLTGAVKVTLINLERRIRRWPHAINGMHPVPPDTRALHNAVTSARLYNNYVNKYNMYDRSEYGQARWQLIEYLVGVL